MRREKLFICFIFIHILELSIDSRQNNSRAWPSIFLMRAFQCVAIADQANVYRICLLRCDSSATLRYMHRYAVYHVKVKQK